MRAMRWVLGAFLCAGITAQAADIDGLVNKLKDKDAATAALPRLLNRWCASQGRPARE